MSRDDNKQPYSWPTRKEWNSLTKKEQQKRADDLVELADNRKAPNAVVPTLAQRQAMWWVNQVGRKI